MGNLSDEGCITFPRPVTYPLICEPTSPGASRFSMSYPPLSTNLFNVRYFMWSAHVKACVRSLLCGASSEVLLVKFGVVRRLIECANPG